MAGSSSPVTDSDNALTGPADLNTALEEPNRKRVKFAADADLEDIKIISSPASQSSPSTSVKSPPTHINRRRGGRGSSGARSSGRRLRSGDKGH